MPNSTYEQCRLAWENVLHQLAAAGYASRHLVKATVFLTSTDLVQAHQLARNEVLGTCQPALGVSIGVGGSTLVRGNRSRRGAVRVRHNIKFEVHN